MDCRKVLFSGGMNMKISSAVVICGICVSLSSCSEQRASTCVGGSKAGMPAERMSDIDKYFMTTDFNKYIGLPLGKLDSDFAIKYDKRTAITKPPAELIGITYAFSDNYLLHVYFSEVKYTTYNSKTNTWDFRKLNNENISGVNVSHVGSA